MVEFNPDGSVQIVFHPKISVFILYNAVLRKIRKASENQGFSGLKKFKFFKFAERFK